MLKQAHLHIKGDVIGVGFRSWCRIQAKINGVSGWVRNKTDEVEAVIQGDEKNIENLIEIIKKGMYTNQVVDAEIYWEPPKTVFEEFEIRR